MNRTIVRVLITLFILVGTAACGGGEEVGGDVGVDGKSGGRAGIDETTTSTTAAPVTTAPPVTAAPKATTTAPPTTAPRPENVITILDDKQGSSFVDKPQYQAQKGSTITWKNASSQPRRIASEDGKTFVSPEIAPGASWTWKVTAAAGVYNYRDTTRPYAVAAQLQVY